jgi:hypothetical protein
MCVREGGGGECVCVRGVKEGESVCVYVCVRVSTQCSVLVIMSVCMCGW